VTSIEPINELCTIYRNYTSPMNNENITCVQGVPINWTTYLKVVMTTRERHYTYQNVQFFIGSKTGVLNVARLKYFLHKFRETLYNRHLCVTSFNMV